jgi:hypothetical protein
LAIGAATVAIVAACAWQAGAGVRLSGRGHRSRVPRGLPGRGGWPLTGTAFALSSGRVAPVRGSLIAAIVGVAGATAGVSFTASLDRLVAEPVRWWTTGVGSRMLIPTSLSCGAIGHRRRLRCQWQVVLGGRSARPTDTTTVRLDQLDRCGRMPDGGRGGARYQACRDVDLTTATASPSAMTLTVVGTRLGPVLNGERLGASAPPRDTSERADAAVLQALITWPMRTETPCSRYAADLELVRSGARRRRDVAALDRLPDVIGLVLARRRRHDGAVARRPPGSIDVVRDAGARRPHGGPR